MNDDKGFNPRSLTGATIAGIVNSDGWICFNPRSLTGATSPSPYVVPIAAFQSTLPPGSDLTLLLRSISLLHFNPRSLTGATRYPLYQSCCTAISIHAPSRERQNVVGLPHEPRRFQSTLPHGSDLLRIEKYQRHTRFQSTLPHGSDLRCLHDYQYRYISIHAPSRERHHSGRFWPSGPKFQSTLPHGSDVTFSARDAADIDISIHAPSRERHSACINYTIPD